MPLACVSCVFAISVGVTRGASLCLSHDTPEAPRIDRTRQFASLGVCTAEARKSSVGDGEKQRTTTRTAAATATTAEKGRNCVFTRRRELLSDIHIYIYSARANMSCFRAARWWTARRAGKIELRRDRAYKRVREISKIYGAPKNPPKGK